MKDYLLHTITPCVFPCCYLSSSHILSSTLHRANIEIRECVKKWSLSRDPKSGRGRLQVVVYQRFQLQGFDWEIFLVLDRWSLMVGGRTSWEVQYIFTSCHPLSVKMELSKEKPWESYEKTPLKQRLRKKNFRFQKALDRQRLATQFWKKNCYQKSYRTQRKEGHVSKTKKQQERKRNIPFRDTMPVCYKRSFNKKRGISYKTNYYFTKFLKNHLWFSWERKIMAKDMLVLAKILRYRCAACHPLQFFTNYTTTWEISAIWLA